MADTENTRTDSGPGPETGAEEAQLLFGRSNYWLVLIGILFIAVGFILMSGGGSDDPTVFDAASIYSFRRITLAPIVVVAGFIIEMLAIFKKS